MAPPATARRRPVRLRRADCSGPGIARVRHRRGFRYRDADGASLNDPATLERIHALAIPPAWREVWICNDPLGHLQATGVDAAGRKQYLYHEVWRERRDRKKFRDMEAFAKALPHLRRRVRGALDADAALTRERVAACSTRLLDIGLFRVGGEEYADDDSGGFGLATLRREHLTISGDEAVFSYTGKSGVEHVQRISDSVSLTVLRTLRRRRTGPEELLCYREGHTWHRLGSQGINDYIKSAGGPEFSAKDFRTWNATVLAAAHLAAADDPSRKGQRNRERIISRVMKDVAEVLGNTPAIARRSYVDPRVVDRYMSGWTIEVSSDPGALDQLTERHRRRLELAVLELLS